MDPSTAAYQPTSNRSWKLESPPDEGSVGGTFFSPIVTSKSSGENSANWQQWNHHPPHQQWNADSGHNHSNHSQRSGSIWGTDDYSKSSTSTHHTENEGVETLLSNMSMRSQQPFVDTRPPKQPVRRPSYNSGSNFTSSLQSAAHSFYPSNTGGSNSNQSLPGLDMASTHSQSTTASYHAPPPQGSTTTSSLAAAAKLTRSDATSIPAPPPGFRRGNSGNQRSSSNNNNGGRYPHKSHKQPPRHSNSGSSLGALKDFNSSMQPRNYQQQGAGGEKTDDPSVTSTTTATTSTSLYETASTSRHSSSEAIRALFDPSGDAPNLVGYHHPPILPQPVDYPSEHNQTTDTDTDGELSFRGDDDDDWSDSRSVSKKQDWLLRMNRKLQDIPVGELDPATLPVSAVMNAWAKTKSAQGASMVELWLKRAQEEYEAGNRRVVPTTKMYTMAGTLFCCGRMFVC